MKKYKSIIQIILILLISLVTIINNDLISFKEIKNSITPFNQNFNDFVEFKQKKSLAFILKKPFGYKLENTTITNLSFVLDIKDIDKIIIKSSNIIISGNIQNLTNKSLFKVIDNKDFYDYEIVLSDKEYLPYLNNELIKINFDTPNSLNKSYFKIFRDNNIIKIFIEERFDTSEDNNFNIPLWLASLLISLASIFLILLILNNYKELILINLLSIILFMIIISYYANYVLILNELIALLTICIFYILSYLRKNLLIKIYMILLAILILFLYSNNQLLFIYFDIITKIFVYVLIVLLIKK